MPSVTQATEAGTAKAEAEVDSDVKNSLWPLVPTGRAHAGSRLCRTSEIGGVRGHNTEVQTLLLKDPQGRNPGNVPSE